MWQHGDGADGRQGRWGVREVSGVGCEMGQEVVRGWDGESGWGGWEGECAVVGGC